MSKLVPEKRVDKNGRVVTKHVLSGDPSSPANHTFPPPVAATEKQRLASKNDYGSKIAKAILGPDEVIKGRHYYSSCLSIKTLRRINVWVDALDPDNERDKRIFSQALNHIVLKEKVSSQIPRDRLACILVEIMPVVTGFAPDRSVTIPYSVNELVNAVNYGAKVNRIVFESAVTEEATALLQYTAFEHLVMNVNYAHPMDSLKDESRWFMENFEKLAPHHEMIIKRGSMDRDYFNELIGEGRAQSLASGTL